MTLIRWLTLPSVKTATAKNGTKVAEAAIASSDNLLRRMREHSISNDPARALMADIWSQRHNVPFMTTLYESAAEMKLAATQLSAAGEREDDDDDHNNKRRLA